MTTTDRLELIKAALERSRRIKREHQMRQVRKGQNLPATVTGLTRRAA